MVEPVVDDLGEIIDRKMNWSRIRHVNLPKCVGLFHRFGKECFASGDGVEQDGNVCSSVHFCDDNTTFDFEVQHLAD